MSRIEHMNHFERAERRRWLANAAHHHFGMCGSCKRTHEHDGSPLYVARQPRRKVFECVECFAFGPGSGANKKSEQPAGFSPTVPTSPITGGDS